MTSTSTTTTPTSIISNDSGWCRLFYDKYAGDHHFNNKITKDVTIEDLEDGSYTIYSDKEAIDYYNSKFTGHFKIPEVLLSSSKLYKLNIFSKSVTGTETIYTVININHKLLKHTIKSKKDIPHEDFLKNLCRYHLSYTNSNRLEASVFYNASTSASALNKIKENSKFVVDKAMVAEDYTFHQRLNNQDEITTELYDYQKCTINWMIDKENNKTTIPYNMNEEVMIGDVYFDMYNQSFNLVQDRRSLTFHGGGLVDEVGLGKTIQMITLAIKNPCESTSYTRPEDKCHMYSRATLIICPNQLCKQWERELENMVSKDYSPVVYTILTKTHFDKYTYQDVLDADFVIVSNTFLDNKAFTIPWTVQVNAMKSFSRQTWSEQDNIKLADLFKTMGEKLVKNPIETLSNANPFFQLIHWHRLIVDEFHEVHANAKYSAIKNILPYIKSNYRWIVTATPFIKDSSMYNSLNFLVDYQNKDGENILTNAKFVDYMATNCFRRNTKKSIKEEYTIPPITDEIRWLKFTATERMMYNAQLANPNNDRCSVYLRQLCCHPQLADETRMALSNCKTLPEIEKMMVSHYKKDVDKASTLVRLVEKRIRKHKQKIIKYKQRAFRRVRKQAQRNKVYAKQMKQKGISPEDSEGDNSDDDEQAIEADNIAAGFIDADDDIVEEEDNEEDPEVINAQIDADNNEYERKLDIYNRLNTEFKVSTNITIENYKEALKQAQERLKELKKDLDGKTTTYNFFNNVVERLRKTSSKDTGGRANKFDKEITAGTSNADLFNLDSSSDDDDGNGDGEDEETCGVCLDDISEDDVGVTKCGHIFCYDCLKTWLTKSNLCPYCKSKLTDKDIFVLSYEKKKKILSPEEKQKDDFINEVGTKLANLIFFLRENNNHTIIFSQWDDLLRKVGRILQENGIKNVFCKGNCYQRDKAIREFNANDKIKVIMLSSDSAASGTNLTKASQVILLDPIYGNYKYRKDQEAQAIGRAHRMGQKNKIKVVRLIIKDSIEEEIYNINLAEDKKYIANLTESLKDSKQNAVGSKTN